MEDKEDIVRLHTAVGIGEQLEHQFFNGLFQTIQVICKNGHEIRLNPLIIDLLFPWLAEKVVLEIHETILLPEYDLEDLKNSLDILLSSYKSERRLHPEVKEETGCTETLDDNEGDYSVYLSDTEDQVIEKPQDMNLDEANPVLEEIPETKVPGKLTRSTEKRSFAWRFFTVISGQKASCDQCSVNISTKHGSTKGLITHIKAFHPSLYRQFLDHKESNQKKKSHKGIKSNSIEEDNKEQNELAKSEYKLLSPQIIECMVCREETSGQFTKCPKNTCNSRFHVSCLPGTENSNCPQCMQRTKSKYRLCTECGKSVQNMSKHLNIHRGIKPERLQCHICEKTLCTANALKVHIDTVHEGIRRFKCKFCDNLFIYASHLKQHILVVHHNYKNPKAACTDCGKQFKFISTMRRHRRVAHLGEVVPKKHSCPHCKEVYFKESQLNAHLRDQHGVVTARKKTVRTRDSLVDKSAILAEYPNLVKPTDLEFDQGLIS